MMNQAARKMFLLQMALGSLCLLTAAGKARAQVALDGSLGRAGALVGPNYRIGSELGCLAGPNLFHSFSQFNLAKGQSATFTGPQEVQNILARVTGGNPSSIDGRIKSEISGANLYLLNPVGVIFGANASLDVSGSFAVSTADYLKLAAGARFEATRAGPCVLSSAPVEAFGFLGPNVGTIRIDHAQLAVNAGRAISIVGGDIQTKQAEISAPSGRVGLISTKSAGEFTGLPAAPIEKMDQGGEIRMDSSSTISVSGSQGGQVVIRGGKLTVDNSSKILAETTGPTSGAGIDIQLKDKFFLHSGAEISTQTTGNGAAGPIRIKAEQMDIDGDGLIAWINANTDSSTGTGRGGDIRLEARDINVVNQGTVSATSVSAGDAGSIKISASHQVRVVGSGPFDTTGLDANSELDPSESRGNAGRIVIETGKLEVSAGATITANSFGVGRGGQINLKADNILLDGSAAEGGKATGIAAQNWDGGGGQIDVHTSRLDILGGATIFAGTYGIGSGGKITVEGKDQTKADRILIDGQGGRSFTGIGIPPGDFGTPGRAGEITVNASRLEILGASNGAGIDSSTVGSSEAGDINIHAGTLRIDGRGFSGFNGIGGVTVSDSPNARGANINVTTDDLTIMGNGFISAGSNGAGPGGKVEVNAGRIQLQHGGSINSLSESSGGSGKLSVTASGPILLTDGGNISTSATASSAQGITVHSADRIELRGGEITAQAKLDGGDLRVESSSSIYLLSGKITSAAGQNGGNIFVDPRLVVLNHSEINASAVNVNGGNIRIGADFFLASTDSAVAASGGPFGVAGEVSILGPAVDLSGSLMPLSSSLLGANSRLAERCTVKLPGNFSSFIQVGRGGLPLAPDDLQPAFVPPRQTNEQRGEK